MLHLQRREIYKKLTPKTRDFVDKYLEANFGIAKFKVLSPSLGEGGQRAEGVAESKGGIELKSESAQVGIGNISKLINKKNYSENLTPETDPYFTDFHSDFLDFLFPEFEKQMLDGKSMKDMNKAVEKIMQTILKGERICIFSDYDSDGVPGISMMRDFFETIKYENVLYYIPDRHKEGYGLNLSALEKIKSENVKLIITIDLGITNIKEVDFINDSGMEVIITDHHLPIETEDGQSLPRAYAILNHKQNSCSYADKNLCGSGVVFKLICELFAYIKLHSLYEIKEGSEKWLLDLVGIATIADMVPLVGENRAIAIYGLFVLSKTRRQGLREVIKNSKTEIDKITEDDIAFSIAPRVNAASRMDHPVHAFNMFSNNLKLGLDSAHYLETLNTTRKESVASIVKKVHKILDEKKIVGELREVVVIGDSDWTPGILGLVASNVVDRYKLSCFVWGKGDDAKNFKGSCRSAGDIHVVKMMSEVKDLFTHFGGHEAAGGFALDFKNLHKLEGELNKNYEKSLLPKKEKEGSADKNNFIEIDLEDVSSEFLKGLSLIGPFGVGNPKPSFKIKNLDSFEVKRFGKKMEHIKINLQTRSAKREAIKFFADREKEKELVQNVHELFYAIEPGWRTSVPRLRVV